MSRLAYFITHPDVAIRDDVPVTQWPLSALGRARMIECLKQPWIAEVTSIYSSTEQKSVDAAQILAKHLSLPFVQVVELGENDRSSTGFLPPKEFELVANEFFEKPGVSVRGWERAIDAQKRVVAAVERLLSNDDNPGAAAIVSHGAVGTLLYCALAGERIDRKWDQPSTGGGNYFRFSLAPRSAHYCWKPIDEQRGD
jgi:broad specificity phosphatase PhoE